MIRQRFGENDLMVVRAVFRELVSGGLAEHVSVRMVDGWESVLNQLGILRIVF